MTAGDGGEGRPWDTMGGPDPIFSGNRTNDTSLLRSLGLWCKWEHCRWIRWALAITITAGLLVISGFWLAGTRLPCRITTTVSGGKVSSVVSVCALPDITDYAPWAVAIVLLLMPWWRIPWERINRFWILSFSDTRAAAKVAGVVDEVYSALGTLTNVSGQELAVAGVVDEVYSAVGPPSNVSAQELAQED
jgi:hypothetical protein